jgi:GT2 family glycosyltransferase
MRVHIVILSYNAAPRTIACLQSVLGTVDVDYQVLLCDNGSTPETVEALSAFLSGTPGSGQSREESLTVRGRDVEITHYGPAVRFIRLDTNLGYAGGNNVGLAYAMDQGGDYVCILNNDVVIEPDTIATLARVFAQAPRIGIAGALNVDLEDGRTVLENGIRFDLTTFKQEFVPLRDSGFDLVDKVIGASMLISVDALRDVGLLDERYFLYWEDMDYCLRTRAKGYGVAICYDAKVRHARHGTSNECVRSYFMTRNSFLLVASNVPARRRIVPYSRLLFTFTRRILWWAIAKRDMLRAHSLLAGVVDGLRGRGGKGRFDRYYGRVRERPGRHP